MLSGCAISQVKNRPVKPCFEILFCWSLHTPLLWCLYFLHRKHDTMLSFSGSQTLCLIQLSGTPESGGQDTWAAELVKLLWKKVNGTQCGSSAVPSEACSLLASCALISSWLGSRLYQMILCICSTGIQVAFETWIIFFSSDDGRPQWICLNSEVKSSSSK